MKQVWGFVVPRNEILGMVGKIILDKIHGKNHHAQTIIKKGSDKMLEILMSDFGLTETEAEKFIEEMD